MKQYLYILIFSFGIILFPLNSYAQVDFNKTPDDDLGNISDAFQEHFFEALKQKGIENYDRAIEALLKCIKIDDSDAILYFELGKNYNKLKNYIAAEDVLKKAIKKSPDNEWYLDELYDVYAQQNDYEKAIKVVQQLVKYHPDYKEDLATLYVRTKNYDGALKILDEMDEDSGISLTRDRIRNQIYMLTGRKQDQIKNLETRLKQNPNQEDNYLALIFRYSDNNENDKAFTTAKKLLEIKPDSELVHLALYKFYIEKNETNKAIESMKIVLNSNNIKPDAKVKVLTDFVKFVSENPEYEKDLIEITTLVGNDHSGKSLVEIAQYYLTSGDKITALKYYQDALKLEGEDYGILRNILLIYIDLDEFELAESKSRLALDKYPSQPLLYLINGVALNKLNKANDAVNILETGLDYIIDDAKMESDFYKQLVISYTALNNRAKVKTFSDKAKQIELTN